VPSPGDFECGTLTVLGKIIVAVHSPGGLGSESTGWPGNAGSGDPAYTVGYLVGNGVL